MTEMKPIRIFDFVQSLLSIQRKEETGKNKIKLGSEEKQPVKQILFQQPGWALKNKLIPKAPKETAWKYSLFSWMQLNEVNSDAIA